MDFRYVATYDANTLLPVPMLPEQADKCTNIPHEGPPGALEMDNRTSVSGSRSDRIRQL